METNNSIFKIPGVSKEQEKALDFEIVEASTGSQIYQELNEINEEIERCRLRNS